MSITYTGTNGLFTRLGALVYMMDAVRTHQNNLLTLFANVQGEYSTADRYMIDQLSGNIEQRIAEAGGILEDVRAAAVKTIVEMAYADSATSTANTMQTKQISDALVFLIRDMDATSNKVNGTTVSAGVLGTGAGNTGNGTMTQLLEAPNILLSSTNDWPNIRADLLEFRCVQDAQNGSISAGSEIFQVRGGASYSGLDYRFPGGSGTDIRITSVCASIDNGAIYTNILNNSDLEDWTSNVPDQWTVSSGTAGTDFSRTTTSARGTYGFKAEPGGNFWKIRQQLGRLTPDRPYVLAAMMKKDALATGTIRLSLQDGSGNILNSGAVAISQSVASLTTSYALVTLAFRAPKALPSTVYVSLDNTVLIKDAAAYVDEIRLAEMPAIAPGGQAVTVLTGTTDWAVDDTLRNKFTNNNEGAFVRAFDRLFDMYRLGLSLPQNYAGSETISDSLIA
jgi:hypothetical protein